MYFRDLAALARPLLLTSVVWAGLLGSCATAGQSPGTPGTSTRVLVADEIRASGAGTALDAVRRLRPQWLRSRGPTSLNVTNAREPELRVYLDDMRAGGVESLQTIRAHTVVSMEYLDGPDASVRFGTGHEGGAIVVRTR